ncbi:GNAT family N-acetyltransferase [Sphingobacterium bambusae]|uniref:GNAT family N-acetyltransferase n=1 Tax=Sphingobacterium bambusae TaxID=662858 RepID=A0ABW6BG89_9SPHI|nr:GNAT family N-acetyltransferase [Sphingobacterium bambusae]WPL49668.1 GNAT family N-acetyltransferase [Sphingobacterium bambusae]
MEFQTLENSDIALEPLQPSDYERLFQVGSDPEIWAQHPDANRYQPDGFHVYFTKLMETDMPFLIIDKARHVVIGATSYYQYDAAASHIAIGFTFLAKSYWGGITNRTVKAMLLDHAFQFVDTVIFHVREHNFRSQAALGKLGALKTKAYPAPVDPSTMQFEYEITKVQWRAQQP